MKFDIACANAGPFGLERDLDTLRRMQDLGVARRVMASPAFDPAGLDRALAEFADRALARV